MPFQVKWVSRKGRYTTLTFKTREAAEACVKRHMEYTGRPARVVECNSRLEAIIRRDGAAVVLQRIKTAIDAT